MGELQRLAQLPAAMDSLCKEVLELRVQLAELPSIKAQLADLQVVTARRCDTQQEVGKLKEQLRKLTGTLVKKIEVAETERVTHLKSELQAMHQMISSGVSTERVERLEQKLNQELQRLAVLPGSLGQLQARFDILAGSQSKKGEDFEHLAKELQTLQDRSDSRIADLQGRFCELQGKLPAQDPTAVLDKLNAQCRTLSTSLAQKADWSEVEQLKHQFSTFGACVASKAESSIAEQLAKQCRAMNAAAATLGHKDQAAADAMRGPGLPLLEQPFLACVASLRNLSGDVQALSQSLQAKADKGRVDQLIEQFQVLADLLAPKLTTRPTRRAPPARPQSARAPFRTVVGSSGRTFTDFSVTT